MRGEAAVVEHLLRRARASEISFAVERPAAASARSGLPTVCCRARRPPSAARGRCWRVRTRRASRRPRRHAGARGYPLLRASPAGRDPALRRARHVPRSWCSCETPNRSASSTIIAEAFGTFTPTSITVVAMSRSISPSAKARMTSSFSSLASRPCSTPIRVSANRGSARTCAATDSTVAVGATGPAPAPRLPALRRRPRRLWG